MPNRDPSDIMPSSGWVNMADLDRMADSAAMSALRRFREEESIQDEMEKVAEKVLDRFLERAFDVPPGDVKALIEVRKDFGFMRSVRDMRDGMVKHGIMVFVGALVLGVLAAIWFRLTGGKV